MKKIFIFLIFNLITISIFAQSPHKMSYQCVVRIASGVLLTNQSVGIRITILQGTTTGSIVYQETAGTAHWIGPNTATNETGFTALPGGVGHSGYYTFPKFYGISEGCYLWIGNALIYIINSDGRMEHISFSFWDCVGASVRCIKD